MSAKHLCICAIETDEYHGYRCDVTDGECMFLFPDEKPVLKNVKKVHLQGRL